MLRWMMSLRALMAISSVTFKSSGSPEVQTQRKGPKPKEKMSLKNPKEFVNNEKGLIV